MSGDVTVEGIDGELSINSMSGDVKAISVTRLTKLSTVSGDITLTNVSAEGLLEASTMSGEILATGIKAKRIDLHAIAGGVTARGIDAADVKLSSMSDDVSFEGALTTAVAMTSPRMRRRAYHAHGRVGFTLDGPHSQAVSERPGTAETARLHARSSAGVRTTQCGTFGDGSAVISARSFNGEVILIKK
jgi:hypothetical protein